MKKFIIIFAIFLLFCSNVSAAGNIITFVNGVTIVTNTGLETDHFDFSSSGFVELIISNSYNFSLLNNYQKVIFLYDSNKNIIARSDIIKSSNFVINETLFTNNLSSIPINEGAYIRIRVANGTFTESAILEKYITDNITFFALMSTIFINVLSWISTAFEFVYKNGVLFLLLGLAICIIIFRMVRRWLIGV